MLVANDQLDISLRWFGFEEVNAGGFCSDINCRECFKVT
jgi:hypothetical protein